MEDAGARSRRGSKVEGCARAPGRDTTLPTGSGAPLAPRSARPAWDRAEGLLQVAGTPLGTGEPRGSRLSRRRREPPSAARPRSRALARPELFQGVRSAVQSGGLSRAWRTGDARSLSPVRVSAGQRVVFTDHARDRR